MALKIQPLSDRVLVQPQEAETKTASGLYIPDSAKEKPQQGKVVAVGKGNKDHDMTVKVSEKPNESAKFPHTFGWPETF